jgi:hypothetical protein
VKRSLVWVAGAISTLVGCTSVSGSSANDPTVSVDSGDGLDGAVGPSADAAADASMPSSTGDATLRSDTGGSTDGASSSAGSGAAGKTGVDAFCNTICAHETQCAAEYDAAGSYSMSGCVSSCQSGNEASTASPPTELLRADYVSALGTCIAATSCTVDLNSAETACAPEVVMGVNGSPALTATAAATAFCHALETSPCGGDAGTQQSCTNGILFYSDTALNAAAACFSMSSCTSVDSCYAAAFVQ